MGLQSLDFLCVITRRSSVCAHKRTRNRWRSDTFEDRVNRNTRSNTVYMRCTAYRMLRIIVPRTEDASVESMRSQ